MKRLSKEDKAYIKYLKKHELYDEIYREFGRDIYLRYASRIHKKYDKDDLLYEGRFIELQEKYGDSYAKFKMAKFLYEDIRLTTGSTFKGILGHAIYNTYFYSKAYLKYMTFLLATTFTILSGLCCKVFDDAVKESEIVYADEIEDYNDALEEYVESLDYKDANDLELIMGVVNDMWDSIEGYKNPEIDANGYYRLDIQNGYGVCRSMADDITAKLNAINPSYNARNVIVKMESEKWVPANINIRRAEEEQSESESVNEEVPSLGILETIWGNHLVTLVDVPNKNITLAIDSTNAGIGVMKNGKLIMFNNLEGNYDIKYYANLLMFGLDDYIKLATDQIESYINFYSIESLEEEYGVDAQNKALTYHK